jgi:hypothetical protein
MFFYQFSQSAQFSGIITNGPGQFDRNQPEFGGIIGRFHMNMRRLVSFTAKEEKTVRPNFQSIWHSLLHQSLEPLVRRFMLENYTDDTPKTKTAMVEQVIAVLLVHVILCRVVVLGSAEAIQYANSERGGNWLKVIKVR